MFDEVGCRRLWVLLNGLPPEAAVWREGGQQWTLTEELLALNLERTDHWGLTQAYLHSDKKFHRSLPDEPFRVPRPGEQSKERERDQVVTDPTVIARFFS